MTHTTTKTGSLLVPGDAIGLRVRYDGAGSRILHVAAAADDVADVPIDATFEGLVVTIRWTLTGDHATPHPLLRRVHLCVEARGRPLPPPIVTPLWPEAAGPIALAMPTETREYWKALYEARHLKCSNRRDLPKRFLFELDRLTLPQFVEWCPDLRPTERAFRRDVLTEMTWWLEQRVRCRYEPLEPPVTIPPVRPMHWVGYVSRVFLDASEVLNRHPPDIAKALLDFAAGVHGEDFQLPPDMRVSPVRAGEPNSYYVFLFAEFALVALEQDVDVDWWKELLPSLVKMQSYFLGRWTSKQRVFSYGTPPLPLDQERRERIDREYDGRTQRIDLITQMVKNLRQSPSL